MGAPGKDSAAGGTTHTALEGTENTEGDSNHWRGDGLSAFRLERAVIEADDPPHSNRRGRRIYIKDSVCEELELGALLWSIDGSYYGWACAAPVPTFSFKSYESR